MRWLGYAWNIAAIWFLLSCVTAPIFLVVRAFRARSKRLFVDEPGKRIDSLSQPPVLDHRWDA